MLSILNGIMPTLQEKLEELGVKGENAAVLGLVTVYDTFTKNMFDSKLTDIMESNPTDMPQGYDLF